MNNLLLVGAAMSVFFMTSCDHVTSEDTDEPESANEEKHEDSMEQESQNQNDPTEQSEEDMTQEKIVQKKEDDEQTSPDRAVSQEPPPEEARVDNEPDEQEEVHIDDVNVEEGKVSFSFKSVESKYLLTCMGAVTVSKVFDGELSPLTDERPTIWSHDGFFLDGQFIEPIDAIEGCDYIYCEQLDDTFSMPLIEYYQEGDQPPPTEYIYPEDWTEPQESVPVIVSSKYSEDMVIEVRYFDDDSCNGQPTIVRFQTGADQLTW